MNKILVTGDQDPVHEELERALIDEGYEVAMARSAAECLAAADREDFDLVLLAMRLPDRDGIEVLGALRKSHPDATVIMLTAYGDIESTRRALSLGAFDFIHKPVTARAIVSIVKTALEIRCLRQEFQQIIYKNKERYGYHNLIGRSEAIQGVLEVLARVVTSDAATILIEGASGTGKSLVAKCLHYNGLRAYQPFVEISCASIPPTLLETELFGYEAGAFTDAKRPKRGLIELAHGGTVFLDEIGEMHPALQAKVLQVLEEKTFRRVGGTKSLEVDTRIIAATNRDLKTAVESGNFRQDLYYRLNVINIHLPTLRERMVDIMPLVEHFIHYYSREFRKPAKAVSDEARELLVRYEWPGNVRELLNTIERIMILEDVDVITPQNLPPEILKLSDSEKPFVVPDAADSLDEGPGADYQALTREFQTVLIRRALERSGGNKSAAARALGLTRLA
ncbi:MAG TPA: sigma-54 dependent transcriptional regulator, partial [Syntrophales bacterium]|nr:sigma-54 dependent transcriptional regulator [Syntrophales bacterium]